MVYRPRSFCIGEKMVFGFILEIWLFRTQRVTWVYAIRICAVNIENQNNWETETKTEQLSKWTTENRMKNGLRWWCVGKSGVGVGEKNGKLGIEMVSNCFEFYRQFKREHKWQIEKRLCFENKSTKIISFLYKMEVLWSNCILDW